MRKNKPEYPQDHTIFKDRFNNYMNKKKFFLNYYNDCLKLSHKKTKKKRIIRKL